MPLDIGAVSLALAEIAYARLVCLYGLARHVPGRLSEGFDHCANLSAGAARTTSPGIRCSGSRRRPFGRC